MGARPAADRIRSWAGLKARLRSVADACPACVGHRRKPADQVALPFELEMRQVDAADREDGLNDRLSRPGQHVPCGQVVAAGAEINGACGNGEGYQDLPHFTRRRLATLEYGRIDNTTAITDTTRKFSLSVLLTKLQRDPWHHPPSLQVKAALLLLMIQKSAHCGLEASCLNLA